MIGIKICNFNILIQNYISLRLGLLKVYKSADAIRINYASRRNGALLLSCSTGIKYTSSM